MAGKAKKVAAARRSSKSTKAASSTAKSKTNGAAPPAPDDAQDIESLWLDPGLGDGLTNLSFLSIPVDKPKDFFRVCPLDGYRKRTEIYTHKIENVIDAQTYIVGPHMRGKVDKARPATIVVCMYRDGSVRLWPLPSPAGNEKDNQAWMSARAAARAAMDRWVKLVWTRGAYQLRDAAPGYAPAEPDWSKLPPFDEMVTLAFGEQGIIRDNSHPIMCDIMGLARPKKADDLDEGASDL